MKLHKEIYKYEIRESEGLMLEGVSNNGMMEITKEKHKVIYNHRARKNTHMKAWEELIELAREIYPSLKEEIIIIEQGKDYYSQPRENTIYIGEKNIEVDNIQDMTINYLRNEMGIEFKDMNIDAFIFLHELGHIYHKEMSLDPSVEYEYTLYMMNFSSTFRDYRRISYEYASDLFAINVYTQYEDKINKIMENRLTTY